MDDEEYALLDFLLTESDRHVTFLALFDRDDIPEAVRDTLRKAAPLIKRGARPQTSPLPLTRDINMRNPFSFAAFPSWNRVFVDKAKPAQAAVYADPAFRNRFREELKQPMAFGNWARITVHEVKVAGPQGVRGPVGGRYREGAGQGRGGHLPRSHAPGRSGGRVHDGVVQHAASTAWRRS